MAPTAPSRAGPPGHPIKGHAEPLARQTLAFLEECARTYGDFVRLRYYWKPIVFLSRPDLIEQVLTVHHRDVVKDVGQRTDRPLIGNGLFLSEGAPWLRQRRMLQPAFHRDRIDSYGAAMVACAERVAAEWTAGGVRDVYFDMSRLTMAVVGRTLFGADVWADASEVAGALGVALDCLARRVRTVELLLPDWLPTPNNLRLRGARARLDGVIYPVIAQRRAAGDLAPDADLLAMLLAARDDQGQGLTDREVRDEAMTMLVGGYETAADLLAWAWLLLAQHPAAEAALSAELADVLGDRSPTINDLPALPYASHVVAEALRLYPPAPALGREATTDLNVDGQRIARGTDVIASQWVMHRDPRYFTDPTAFIPERWADGLADRLPRYAYFPFGGGPRLCIGHAFAKMEATLVLATLARRFRLTAISGEPPAVETLPTLRPVPGLRMNVHARAAA